MWMAAGAKVPDLSQGLQFEYLFALFGVPFVLVGLGMLASPLWSWLSMRQTVYLITDRRAILIQAGGATTTFRSYEPHQLQHIYRKVFDDDTGNIIIAQEKWRDSNGDKRTENIGFMNIRNAREAEMRLKQLARRAE
ncbi:hypothetical protein IQ266_19845 [filamentous cyanobacterium LEGE 11480]|uniref:Uncharacterized protein n=1 Tax=Romeriopsis navalis LEGE 11480 TaxID=2777977 RepID=A0A928VTK8_9CYAN|nr:hypothetical protein [Romeriopsis navalis]MBE9031994.1 hypothetical protein [Romeriopsis navalis LEGE 11480]